MRRKVIRNIQVFLFLIVVYLAGGLVAYMAPQAPVLCHVQHSLESGDLREDYPKAVLSAGPEPLDAYTLDNFTDALILNQAIHLRSEGLRGILLVPRYEDCIWQYRNLAHSMANDTAGGNIIHYARYWHGSTFLVRGLLALTDYSGVCYLLYVLSTVLLLWTISRLWRIVGKTLAVLFLFGLLSVNVYVMQFSLQFAPVLLVALGGVLWMTYHKGMTKEQETTLFFVLGSLTAFLDLITTPSLTLGLPLVVMVALRNEYNVRRGLAMLVEMAGWWLAAYVLTWLAKWGLATLLTGENIFADAYGQGAFWSKDGISWYSQAVTSTLGHLHWRYVVALAVILLVSALCWRRPKGWPLAVQYAVVMLIPMVYFLLMAHPAANHSWFNYRTWVITVVALLMAMASFVDSHKGWLWIKQKLKRQ